jgi:hypothetical protein
MMNGISGLPGRRTARRMKVGKGVTVTGIVLALALLTVGVGSAWAGSGIALCVPKKEGAALLTPKHGVCRKGYSLANVDMEGKEGKPGAAGKQGAEGKAGIAGAKGEPGEAGKLGGAPGPEGKEGPEGKAGPEGKTGLSPAEVALLKNILPHIQFVASGIGKKPTVQFFGVNLQVVNGVGKTESANGAGNIVIGYDENTSLNQSGSHNLILGEEQTFTSYGGIVAGYKDTISGAFASVTGGGFNQATGKEAAISGGWSNTASAENASVSGGRENQAKNLYTWIGGGQTNTVTGKLASIFGGHKLEAAVEWEAIP